MDEKVSLVVLEAYERDVGMGIVRVGSEVMESIGASSNDIIELSGHGKTAAKLLPLYPPDEKMSIIRMDGLIRINAGANIGDKITIRKISCQEAEKVTILALESIPPIDGRQIAHTLNTIPVTKGDRIMVLYFGGRLTFQVIDTKPDSFVVINPKTIFDIPNIKSGLVPSEQSFVYPQDSPSSKKD